MDIANTLRELIISVPALVMAIVCHEVSHGYIANRLGDPTARMMGRLTLNPLPHIDPIGTILLPMILLISGAPVFGYAKPVPINPFNFREPRKHMALSGAAGPVVNVIIAALSSLAKLIIIVPLSMILPGSISNAVVTPLILMLHFSIQINLFLAAFNLIPVPPLDGSRVLAGFLNERQAASYSRIEPYGFIIIFALIFTGIAGYFIFPIYHALRIFVPFY